MKLSEDRQSDYRKRASQRQDEIDEKEQTKLEEQRSVKDSTKHNRSLSSFPPLFLVECLCSERIDNALPLLLDLDREELIEFCQSAYDSLLFILQ